MRIILSLAIIAASTVPSLALPICSGGHRADRKVTCIVDGDTGWENGVKWRLKDIDAPEISHPECKSERRDGIAARDRVAALLGDGNYRLEAHGTGYYGRELVKITLSNGQDLGQLLLREHLAQPWPNHANPWCR
ncbi:thermonuclease family protein [Jiella endophytica]|uniref:Thermonuclease family protein n=1 Tax=Jiella endophytica TaxID=2558362 RepID=A0A4Y8RCS0_9HYPH|nr:thermonuclease family protein [Jiella endophytica]TFF19859.1 thermonuclease family protein [Jiella endophytica]